MCTDLLIVSKTRDGQNLVVNGRSQEFSTPLGYRVVFRKAGVNVVVTQPNKWSWTPLLEAVPVDLGVSKYDYMGIMITTPSDPWTAVTTSVFDGMNSVGLSAGSLNAPGSKYQPKSDEPGAHNVFAGFFVDWLLSNYATCKEVKAAFAGNLRVVAETEGLQGTHGISYVEKRLHVHFAVHDAEGNSLVIEFVDGEAKITDNPVGVLTNLPVFSWHLTNLGQYAYLSNFSTPHAVKFGEVTYAPPGSITDGPADLAPQYRSTGIPGMGDGLAGIPGDFRPASRFVRIAYLKKFAVSPESENEAVSQAFHLLNAVDMVKGSSAEKGEKEDDPIQYDTPQFVVVKDLVKKVFYVRMYESPMPYSIAFKDCPHFAANSANGPDGIQIVIPTETLAQPLPLSDVFKAPEAAQLVSVH